MFDFFLIFAEFWRFLGIFRYLYKFLTFYKKKLVFFHFWMYEKNSEFLRFDNYVQNLHKMPNAMELWLINKFQCQS